MASGDVIAPQRRRLTDLYMRGVSHSFADDDPNEEGIEVWVSKLSPLQRKAAGDKANAARALILAVKNEPEDSPVKLEYIEAAASMGYDDRKSKIELLIAPDVQKAIEEAEAEIAASDKWAENDFLVSLQDAWNDGLSSKYLEDPDDVEAKRVFDALREYTVEVEARVDKARESLAAGWKGRHESEIDEKILDRLIDTAADFRWVEEFHRWQIFFAVRLPEDHKEQYFVDKVEVDELDQRVFDELFSVFTDLSVSSLEGKG